MEDEKHDIFSIKYNTGFGNEFESEMLPNALPVQNNPHRCPYGLYAEQISGSAFTAPNHKNRRTWTYRLYPSVHQGEYEPCSEFAPLLIAADQVSPERLRWKPAPIPSRDDKTQNFVEGLITIAESGDPADRNGTVLYLCYERKELLNYCVEFCVDSFADKLCAENASAMAFLTQSDTFSLHSGLAIHLFSANTSMENSCFTNSDGDMLIVPETGILLLETELGKLVVRPKEIAVIPRGFKFSVHITDALGKMNGAVARGYILEVYSGCFELPERGVIGANGLANQKDFRYPVAACNLQLQNFTEEFASITKFQRRLFKARLFKSPYNVVAWRGNYSPFVYDLSLFCPVNSVLYDHMDPSIFTVLTVPSTVQGTAVADFVLFPPRWAVQENTFRLPYFHRNCMSEYMGVISGAYEAKSGSDFKPGAGSLHSIMSPHGPDASQYTTYMNTQKNCGPKRMSSEDFAFMFETSKMLKLTKWAMSSECRDRDYHNCWEGLPETFDPNHH